MKRLRRLRLLVPALLLLGVGALAQRMRSGYGGGEIEVGEEVHTAREVPTRNSTQPPDWTNSPAFAQDVFTFTRIRYDKRPGWHNGDGWTTDLPDADINLSFRLQQMTSILVDPDGRLIRLTDPDLPNYPFLFASAPSNLSFTDEESAALRKHLLNGGFLLMDDFWGDREWAYCEEAMKQVFPNRKFDELPLNHPIYHGVFEITSKAQVANLGLGTRSEQTGVTWETRHEGDVRTVHHRGISDDHGRLMVLALHNTDNGDGWEREGESDYYFHNFSEKIAYPLGINIIFYALTH